MASLIPQDFIRDLIVQTDIVTLIDSYVPLKKKGKDHWGLCPFHHDVKTPSFSVSPQKQFFYCFTCKKTGNAIGFIQDHLRMTFVESVEVLASKIGVEVPYSDLKNNSDERRLLLEILEKASNFFETNLLLVLDSLKKKDSSSTHSTTEPEIVEIFFPSFSITSSSL